jgi:hypothetical protein
MAVTLPKMPTATTPVAMTVLGIAALVVMVAKKPVATL